MPPKLSVVVCTWNRAALLQKTLERMKIVTAASELAWELIVINNNCSDNTSQIITSYAEDLPIREVVEREQGLSAARNRGVREAKGDLILWTDDDVLISEQWLSTYALAADNYPQEAIFGGPIFPWFDGTPPEWLKSGWREVESAYAIRDLGEEAFLLSSNRLPYGANYAIRRNIQSQHLYDTSLGRKGTQLLSGEESQVMQRILAEGHSGRWLPNAKVEHFIGSDRQTLGYLRKYYYAIGITTARMKKEKETKDQNDSGRRIFGINLWLIRAIIESELRYSIRRMMGKTASALGDLRIASISRGAAAEGIKEFRGQSQSSH